MLFVSVCLFFHSSESLLIHSCIFSVSFSTFLIIFTIIILNYFSGNFPISFSFIWTSVFLVCSFICAVFSCLFILFFLSYFVWGLPFLGSKESWISFLKKVELFLPFGFYLLKGGPSGLCELCIGWDLCWVFCLSVFHLIGKAKWSSTPVCWWLGLYFCFVCCLNEASCTGC